MLLAKLVTFQTALARILAGKCFEANDLSNVAAALRMRLARPMTRLTALELNTAMIEHRFPMRAVIVRLGNVLVASAASIGAGV